MPVSVWESVSESESDCVCQGFAGAGGERRRGAPHYDLIVSGAHRGE